ncbi:hypothetical protein Ddc_11701 [Ditylenchus destructor]|nr:hypothetical protein Ddc_11701 [Ditylenchus destructor]
MHFNEDCIARGGKCVDTKANDCDFFYKGDYAEELCKDLVFKCCLPKHTVACRDLNGWCKFSCDDSEQPFGENVCYGAVCRRERNQFGEFTSRLSLALL